MWKGDQVIIKHGEWVKKGGRKIVMVVNCMNNTVYFYSDRTGIHYQYSVRNFLSKFKPKGE